MFTPTVYSAAGGPTIVPILVLAEVEEAKNFYHRAFGFTKHQVMLHADGRLAVAEMTWPGGALYIASPDFAAKYMRLVDRTPSRSFLQVVCDDVDALFANATEAGATVISPPQDQFWGVRNCLLADPYGQMWVFARPGGEYCPPADGI